MQNFFGFGNDFLIWLGSVAAGTGALVHFLRLLIDKSDIDDQSRLCGTWYGYGYFHYEYGERFYRESIDVSRSIIFPWRLIMRATPCSTGSPEKYTGSIWRIGDYIYSSTKQGTKHDPCFEIGMIRLSNDHVQDKIIGIHLGQSYVTQVHVATAFIWSKTPLDSNASLTSEFPTDAEDREFRSLCSRYFELKADFFELQLRYRSAI